MATSRKVAAVVVGAGHNGLATSHGLSQRGIDHVVLERGVAANSWRTERWDSLRLLTPNWQTRVPGHAYGGDDPDGFMTAAEVADFIEAYSTVASAPLQTETTVTSVRASDGGYSVTTDKGEWHCRCVMLASGACNQPNVPALAESLPPGVESVTPMDYRNPDSLPDGGVMVVGASATGVQLADEIHRSGRPVTLSVGEHVRLPRVYRGRDIFWWMDSAGVLDEGLEEIDDVVRARNIPSPQLVGTPERSNLDLNALTDRGVELIGKLSAIRDGKALFSGGLRNVCNLSDLKMNRLLNTIDEWVTTKGMDGEFDPPHRFDGARVPEAPPLELDLASGKIRSVVWATGFKPDYSWLDVDVLDRKGKLKHDGGVVAAPGLYALGLTFLRSRKSTFIHGAEDDSAALVEHLAGYLAG